MEGYLSAGGGSFRRRKVCIFEPPLLGESHPRALLETLPEVCFAGLWLEEVSFEANL